MDDAADRIIPLDRTEDFRIARGEPDVRGWSVFARDGRRIGRVAELLVDVEAMKVRYLDVTVGPEYFEGEGGHRILVPVGYARLDEDQGRVLVDVLDSDRVATLPEYDDRDLTEEFAADLEVRFAAGEPIGSRPVGDGAAMLGSEAPGGVDPGHGSRLLEGGLIGDASAEEGGRLPDEPES